MIAAWYFKMNSTHFSKKKFAKRCEHCVDILVWAVCDARLQTQTHTHYTRSWAAMCALTTIKARKILYNFVQLFCLSIVRLGLFCMVVGVVSFKLTYLSVTELELFETKWGKNKLLVGTRIVRFGYL